MTIYLPKYWYTNVIRIITFAKHISWNSSGFIKTNYLDKWHLMKKCQHFALDSSDYRFSLSPWNKCQAWIIQLHSFYAESSSYSLCKLSWRKLWFFKTNSIISIKSIYVCTYINSSNSVISLFFKLDLWKNWCTITTPLL